MTVTTRDAPDIVEEFVQGRPDAHRVVRDWVEGVVRFGRWRFGDPESVIQEVLLKLLRIAADRGFEGASTFKTFVISVSRYTCIDVYRRERHVARMEHALPDAAEFPDPEPGPESRLTEGERIERLAYIYQMLPANCRRLWQLVYVDGLPAMEVANRLEISVENVYVRNHRCLEKARQAGARFVFAPMR